MTRDVHINVSVSACLCVSEPVISVSVYVHVSVSSQTGCAQPGRWKGILSLTWDLQMREPQARVTTRCTRP